MRIVKSDSTSVSCWELSKYRSSPEVKYETTKIWRTKEFSRSDLVKVGRVNGWRKPTSYKASETITNPLAVKAKWTKSSGDAYLKTDNRFLFGATGNIKQPVLPTSDDALQSVLTYRALAKVKDVKVNLAVALAEMGETIGMIVKSFAKIRKAYRLAKAGRWKEAFAVFGVTIHRRAAVRNLASGWLELQFGWMPLISDIYGSIEEINRKVLNEGYVIVGRARSETKETVLNSDRASTWGLISWDVKTAWELSKIQKVSLWFRVDMPSLQRAAAIGLLNPALIVWERTPFSFMIDWVTTVGDWLESLDATLGLVYLGGTHTYRGLLQTKGQAATPSGMYAGSPSDVEVTPGAHRVMSMVRNVINSTPKDKFVFTNPYSTSHAITASALLITSLKAK